MIFPHTTSRRIVLRPATTADQARFTRTLLRTGIESFRPAAVPTATAPVMYNASFVVVRRVGDEVLGFSTLHGYDPAGHIRSGVYLDPSSARLGVGAEALYLSINYAFAAFDIDKVIAQTTEASFDAFGLTPEDNQSGSILPGHLYFRGRLWDVHNFQLTRREWEDYIDTSQDGVLPPPLTWRTPPHQRSNES